MVDLGLWPSASPHRIALMPAPVDIPTHVGPCEIGQLGNQIAVRCPAELDTFSAGPAPSGNQAHGAGWCSGAGSGG